MFLICYTEKSQNGLKNISFQILILSGMLEGSLCIKMHVFKSSLLSLGEKVGCLAEKYVLYFLLWRIKLTFVSKLLLL